MHIKKAPNYHTYLLLTVDERVVLCKVLEYAKKHLDDLDLIDLIYEQGYEPEGLDESGEEDEPVELWFPPINDLIIKINSMRDNVHSLFNLFEFSVLSKAIDDVSLHIPDHPDKIINKSDWAILHHMRETTTGFITRAVNSKHENN